MHLCILYTICNVSFLSFQNKVHQKGWRHAYNAFKLYKNEFFDIVVPRRKRNLQSNKILRVLNKREMKILKEYWMIIGFSLPMHMNVGIFYFNTNIHMHIAFLLQYQHSYA